LESYPPYIQLLLYLAGPAILGVIAGVLYIWRDFTAYKLYIAENYVKQEAINSIQRDMREMKSVLYQIAAKVGVTINNPF
jgi:hypothetical protein